MKFQDPKYSFAAGGVWNRQSGEQIPLDEPVFVFRARDRKAVARLIEYAEQVDNPEHQRAVFERVEDFNGFAAAHPERMKEPDTE